jgi:hypothetical protein
MAVANGIPNLGEVLLREGLVTQSQLRSALSEQKNTAHSLGRVLVDKAIISEDVRTNVLKKTYGLQTVDLSTIKIDPILTVLIPSAFAQKHRILPIRQENNGVLVVAMEDPSDMMVLDAIKNQVGMKIRPYIARSDQLAEALIQHYSGQAIPVVKKSNARTKRILWSLLKVFFTFMYFAPILGGFLVIMFVQEAQDFVNATNTFDLGLYAVLLSALWAIIIFEINGLLFGRDNKKEDEYD